MNRKSYKKRIKFIVFFLVVMTIGTLLIIIRFKNNNLDKEKSYTIINPEISFLVKDLKLNRNKGFNKELEAPLKKLDLIPIDAINTKLRFNITNEKSIDEISYIVSDKDKKKEYISSKVELLDNDFILNIPYEIIGSDGKLLTIKLKDNNIMYYYYYDLFDSYNIDTYANIDFVKRFATSTYDSKRSDEYTKYMESDITEKTDSFNDLTIYSNYDLLTWNNLEPEVLTDMNIHIIENVNNDSLRFNVYYGIEINTEYGREAYKVKEEYRTRCVGDLDYLVEFGRKLDRHIDLENDKFSGNLFNLGLNCNNFKLAVSSNEKYISIVCDGQIYRINTDEKSIEGIFTSDKKKDDINSYNSDYYTVGKIIQNNDGSVLFTISGLDTISGLNLYGDIIYLYKNGSLKVINILESNKSLYETANSTIKYVNNDKVLSYIKNGNLIYNNKIIDKDINENTVKSSVSSRVVGYCKNDNECYIFTPRRKKITKIDNGLNYSKIIDFIGDDIIVGISSDAGQKEDTFYESIKIYDSKLNVIKEALKENNYISSITIEDGLIKLIYSTSKVDTKEENESSDYINTGIKSKYKIETYYSNISRKGYRLIIE